MLPFLWQLFIIWRKIMISLILALLIGCGGDDKDTAGADTSAPVDTADTSDTADTAETGDTADTATE
jgi:hypothetical protein